ncbi:helix-turn-helix domain-containing protein [Paenibacillus algicola]|nr:helix-turn-helix transcriptional regulator [Paenibacillus algicola]
MKKADITKQQLAESTGYSYQYIYDLLNGRRRWNEESLEKVCHSIGLEVNVVSSVSAQTPNLPEHTSERLREVLAENKRLCEEVGNLKTAIKALTKGW